MAPLPIDTRPKIEQQIEDKIYPGGFRSYLGISSIASSCPRKLWYSFRWVKKEDISARLNRLFQRGHREEEIIQADLRSIGIHHHSDQKEVIAGNGHIKGHIDDILENVPDAPKTPHLGEYKTHNNKSFTDMKKKRLIKSKPVHHGQMICYMHLLGLKRGLYIASNKDNDERYYERIKDDPEKAKELLKRGVDIISTEIPPQKIGGPSWFECKWCNYYQICHYGEEVLKNCRTCKFGDIHDGGIWKCAGYKLELAKDQQELGCSKHKLLEGLK